MRVYEVLQASGYLRGENDKVISKDVNSPIWRIDVPDAGSPQNAKFIAEAMNQREHEAQIERDAAAIQLRRQKEWDETGREQSAVAAGQADEKPQPEVVRDPELMAVREAEFEKLEGDESEETVPKRSTWLDPALTNEVKDAGLGMPIASGGVTIINNYPGTIEEDRAQTHNQLSPEAIYRQTLAQRNGREATQG